MKIFSQMQVYQPILYQQPNINKKSRYTFQNQSYDTVTFGAMKKSDFVGIDRACIDKFKAPIEKFKTNDHLQAWAKKKLEPIMTKVYEGRYHSVAEDRQEILEDWKTHLNNPKNEFKDTEKLLIMSAITQPLERTNDILPPRLNKTVLANVMDRVKNGEKININKTYTKELRETYLKDKLGKKKGEWVIIPSKINNSEKFKENVEALKVLSNYTWCTHNKRAELYLGDGDFHIYVENEQPKIGIRFIGDTVQEIQGEKNDGNIPYKYATSVLDHINGKKLSLNAKSSMEKLKFMVKDIEVVKNDLSEAIKNNDAEEIFKYLGYIKNDTKQKSSQGFISKIKNIIFPNKEKEKIASEGLTLDFYKQPGSFSKFSHKSIYGNMTFDDLGIGSMEYLEKFHYEDEEISTPEVMMPEKLKKYKNNIKQEYHDLSYPMFEQMLLNQNTNECRSSYYPHQAWTVYQPDRFKTGLIKDFNKVDKLAEQHQMPHKTFNNFRAEMGDFRNYLRFRILNGLQKRHLLK